MNQRKNRFSKTIKGKILIYTGSTMLILLGALIGLYSRDMYWGLVESNERNIVIENGRIATEIETKNLEAVTYAKTMAMAQESGMFGKRQETVAFLYNILENVSGFYDVYVIYEPNADGQDELNKGQRGSDASGRFNSSLANENGRLVLVQGVNMEKSLYYQGVKDKYLSGSRERHMITEPYVYEGVMMVEQTYPVVINGRFAGITGVDRTLEDLCANLASMKPYKTADFILISRLGGVIAATMDPRLNTRKIEDTPYRDILKHFYGSAGSSDLTKTRDPEDGRSYLYTGATVKTGEWTLVMRVAEDEILEPIRETVFHISVLAVLGTLLTLFVLVRISNSITDPIRLSVEAAEQIADGNLTASIASGADDETGQLLESMRAMTLSLDSLVGQVQRSCIQVTTSATEIAASARQLEAVVSQQAASTTQVSSGANEISATTAELAQTMNGVTQVVSQTADLVTSGRDGLMLMATHMDSLSDAKDSISSKLAVINEKAGNINRIVTTISKVADQTNLLSLNAAIEAEKAGEMGLGFGVVAREIRRLADRTAVATLDIERMVKEMQSAVSAGVMEMDKFSEHVRQGTKAIDTMGTQIEEIMSQVQSLTPRFSYLNEGMHAQSEAAQQISEAMLQLSEVVQQTLESVGEFNQATGQLREAARGLQEEVSRFKVTT